MDSERSHHLQGHFFDNTFGWVLRKHCMPFVENFELLQQRKKMPSFIDATKARARARPASLIFCAQIL